MDARDLRLVARIAREPTASMAALAKEADLTSNAARERLAKLRDQGVFMGVFAFPNAALLGRTSRLAVYGPPGEDVRAGNTLRIDDVQMYSVNHDGQLAVTWLARAPDEAPPAALDKLVGAAAPRVFSREAPPLSPPGAALSRDQWRLVAAMIGDARASNRRLASETGLSERVVARQRAWLEAGNHVTLDAGFLSNLAEGIVLFHLFVAGPGTLDEKKVCSAVNGVIQNRTSEPRGLYLFCHGEALGDALVARDKAARLPGVEHVELILEKEAGVAVERLQAMCAKAGAEARR